MQLNNELGYNRQMENTSTDMVPVTVTPVATKDEFLRVVRTLLTLAGSCCVTSATSSSPTTS